jgi:ribonuclease Z
MNSIMNRCSGLFTAFLLLLLAQPVAAFDGIRLTLLAGAEPSGDGAPIGAGIVVEASDQVLLFDCGAGSLGRLHDARFLTGELTAVFLTSLDSAHIDGCGELLNAWLSAGAQRSLPVWGPAGTVDAVRAWVGSSADMTARIDPHEVGENLVYDSDEVRVTAIVADYPVQRRGYGYRVERERRAVALLGGAGYSENVARGASGAQVVACDVAAVAKREQGEAGAESAFVSHATPEDAGRIWHAARAYLGLYSSLQLSGVTIEAAVARTRRYFRGPIQVARALMVIEVQNEVQVRSVPSEGPRR